MSCLNQLLYSSTGVLTVFFLKYIFVQPCKQLQDIDWDALNVKQKLENFTNYWERRNAKQVAKKA